MNEHDAITTTTSFLTEYSVHEYTREKIVRANQARQTIDRKEQKTDHNEEDLIRSTISEDLGDGQNAKLDASLKSLGVENERLLLPTDEMADEEINFINSMAAVTPLYSGNLADHQVQLMLLEQQNKKRLMVARQEGAAEKAEREKLERTEIQIERTEQVERASSSIPEYRSAKGGSSKREASFSPPQPTKKQKQLSSSNDPLDRGRYSSSKGDSVSSDPSANPLFQVLYAVACSDNSSSAHPFPICYDLPAPDRSFEDRAHFVGKYPVLGFGAYMNHDDDDAAFVVIRVVECSESSIVLNGINGSSQWKETIYLKSKILKEALRSIANCYHQLPSNLMQTSVEFKSKAIAPIVSKLESITPFGRFIFHHTIALKSYASKFPHSKKCIGALLGYCNERYHFVFKQAKTLFSRGRVSQKTLPFLFRPNQLLVSVTHGTPTAFVLQEWPTLDDEGRLELACWSFQTDGAGFTRKRTYLGVSPINENEDIPIRDMIAYPLMFAHKDLVKTILDRGKKQWELRNAAQVTYEGLSVARDRCFSAARFMVDHKMFRKMHENSQAFTFPRPPTTYLYDRLPAYLAVTQTPSQESLLLMPPDLHGFYLNEKKWIKIFVEGVQSVVWNKKAFERLVLPPKTKDLVRALVAVRASKKGISQGLGVVGKRSDITTGKGNGLIMLLHGGPGTGKTLTAESVAEIAEMPLYRVTCGDIGTNAEAVEKYLSTVLYLGKIWNCVLLLDEADVFLEERSMADLERNSLVSVFLRVLEYYDGILILTSNRVGTFDSAFKSRIQVALHYENLNRYARKRIWTNFLDMLEEDEEDVNFAELRLRLDDLAEKELNGRQIRNIVTTARQLAMYRQQRLDWEHLDQALSVSSDFNKYLERVQGHTEDQWARDTGLR